MRNILLGFVLSLVVIGAGTWAYRVWQWREYQNTTAWASRVTYSWLAEPVIKTKDGQSFTRAQVLDALIKQAADGPKPVPNSGN